MYAAAKHFFGVAASILIYVTRNTKRMLDPVTLDDVGEARVHQTKFTDERERR